MTMTPGLRKFALTAHIALSVGWIGGVFAYLVLVAAAMTSRSDQTLRAAWIAMELIGWYLIVPLALASLLTGSVMSLGTRWGLFRHYWVLVSFLLTIVATAVLLQHMPTVSSFASVAVVTDSANVSELRGALRGELLHAGVGVLLLLGIQALNVYKPQGMTAYGRRIVPQVTSPSRPTDDARPAPVLGAITGTPRWVKVVGIHAIGLALLFVALHLTGGGMGSH
jgi:hypothetical protein